MLRKCRVCLFQGTTSRFGMVSAVALFSVAIAGCSADVGRFDFASVSSPGDTARWAPTPSEPLRRNAGIPVDPETPRDGGYQRPPMGNDRTPVGNAREPAVRMSGLPEPTSREPLAPAKPASAPVLPRANATAQPATGRQVPTSSAPVTAAGGQVIEVLQGDTLYGLSRKHRVAISELMTLNNLQNPTIKPGQKLTLPGGKLAVVQRAAIVPAKPAVPAAAPTKAAARPVAAAQPAPVAAPAPADWAGSYTVASGDSLFAIARKHGVKAADLQTANSIADPTKVRPGIVLKVPGPGVAPQPIADVEAPPPAAKTVGPAKTASGAKPKIINAPTETAPATQVAALGSNAPSQTDASAGTPKTEPAAAGGDAG